MGSFSQQQQVVEKTSLAYLQFVNALHSKKTKVKYTEFLNAFLLYANRGGCDRILELAPKEVQSIIISYIIDMKENQGLSPSTMSLSLAAVKTFFQLNDFEGINWFKVKKYIGEFYRVAEDRPYTREEIKRLVDAAHIRRDKAILLLLASSGMRRGGIIKLQLKHLTKIEKYKIYKIDVYKQAKEHYYTFCTPEARKAIEDYLNWREKLGEKLTPESPLFREQFDTRFGVQSNIVPITEAIIRNLLKILRQETGIVENQHLTKSIKRGAYRSKIMITHGFRKFFDTTCTSNGMETLYVEMVMGHDLGLKRSYYKPQMNELLEGNDRMSGYVSVINDLTINDENRLRDENMSLKQTVAEWAQNRQEMAELKKRLEEIDIALGTAKASIDN